MSNDGMLSDTIPQIGIEAYRWARDLYPICRSLTGSGVRETLGYLQSIIPGLRIESVPTGTRAFDWTIPKEWTIRAARLVAPDGEVVADFSDHNLHVVGYSIPIDTRLTLEELQPHLHSLPEQPDAIPYVTSYYRDHWGFCLAHKVRRRLVSGIYHAVIDSELTDGVLNYGELILPGQCEKEILLSTNICHPSVANNELSGPVVTAALARWLADQPRRYTYRILFLPETIGSIVYLSRHAETMKQRTIAGYVVTCIGDERAYSLLTSRNGNSEADRVARRVLAEHAPAYREYSFLERGSDERQFCSPGIDLPVASLMRSKYATYPEYHTSLDDLTLISPAGLQGGFGVLAKCLVTIETSRRWRTTVLCEPQLSRFGLYPTLSTRQSGIEARDMLNVLAYSDGSHDVLALCELTNLNSHTANAIIEQLVGVGLLEPAD